MRSSSGACLIKNHLTVKLVAFKFHRNRCFLVGVFNIILASNIILKELIEVL